MRSACNSSSPRPAMSGGRGELPSRSLGGQRGPFSHVREWPPLFNAALGLQYSSLKREIFQNQMRFFSESASNKCTSLASKPNFTAVCRAYAIGSIFAVGMTATTSCPFAARCRCSSASHQLADVDLGRDAALASEICTGRTPAVTLRLSTPAAASFALCSAVSVTVSPMTVSV